MASTTTATTESVVYERRFERVHKYHWPAVQLNLWMLIMLISACTVLGIFGTFVSIQQTLLLPVPWYVQLHLPDSTLIADIALLLGTFRTS